MNDLRYVLLSDGSSDNAIVPLLTWILRGNLPGRAIQPQWADLRHLSRPPKTLAKRIRFCVSYYDCDLLFVHRDAEVQSWEDRVAEILEAVAMAEMGPKPRACSVVPVRMQEAWLLFDEKAIRSASGNPHGKIPLAIPAISDLERLPDPKSLLHQLLREATGLPPRRKKLLNVRKLVHRVPDFIGDFAPLRGLSAFRALEEDIAHVVSGL
jgi:hypothetical protein